MSLINIIGALIAFSVLVIVHEFGHFTMAKLNGVKVEEFSIGMGPKLFGIKKGETEYALKLLPIGGYVKMLGEDGEDTSDERAFTNKTSAQKLSIVAAGPFMNLVLAIVLFAVVGSFRGYLVPVASEVIKGSPAQVMGIQKGDKIVKVNDKKIVTWEDFVTQIYTNKDKNMDLTYIRDNESKTVNITPIKDPKDNRYMIGIYPSFVKNPGFKNIVAYGFTQTTSIIRQTGMFFKMLFSGGASANDFGGPITIIRVSAKAAEAGIVSLMSFGAYLSVQLAIFNIIPFPALDGGWIVLFLLEIITRKKVDKNKVGIINYIGFAVLMSLMILVIIKDILYPVKF